MERTNDGCYRDYCDISKWVSIYELATILENWWIFILSFIAFFRCNALFIPSTPLYIGIAIRIYTTIICFLRTRNVIIRFETFSSFGNIFVFGMLIFSIAFYLQQYFYMQNKNKNDIEVL